MAIKRKINTFIEASYPVEGGRLYIHSSNEETGSYNFSIKFDYPANYFTSSLTFSNKQELINICKSILKDFDNE